MNYSFSLFEFGLSWKGQAPPNSVRTCSHCSDNMNRSYCSLFALFGQCELFALLVVRTVRCLHCSHGSLFALFAVHTVRTVCSQFGGPWEGKLFRVKFILVVLVPDRTSSLGERLFLVLVVPGRS